MVIIGFSSYPTESVKEFAKRFMEQPPLPAYITLRGPYVSSEVGKGIVSFGIFEVAQSQISEAMQVIIARYAKYFGVPGYTYSVKIWLEAKEALKSIGMG